MKVPTPEELNPRLAVLNTTRNAAFSTRATLLAQTAPIRERLHRGDPQHGNAEANRIHAALGDALEPEVLPDRDQYSKLLAEMEKINAKLGILDSEIQKEKAIGSRAVCDAVRPDYNKLVKDFATQLAATHKAHLAYLRFLDDVEATGASTTALHPVFPTALGHPRDRSGAYYYAFKEMRENGHITHDDIPVAVR